MPSVFYIHSTTSYLGAVQRHALRLQGATL